MLWWLVVLVIYHWHRQHWSCNVVSRVEVAQEVDNRVAMDTGAASRVVGVVVIDLYPMFFGVKFTTIRVTRRSLVFIGIHMAWVFMLIFLSKMILVGPR